MANVDKPKEVEVLTPAQKKEAAAAAAKPVAVPETPEPKKRGRPAGSKTNQKKDKPAPAKIESPMMDDKQLKVMLATFSAVIAAKPGMEVWALSAAEIDQLCEPIYKMMKRSSVMSKMSEANADALALAIAALAIFIPKFMMWNMTRPKKKKTGDKINYEPTTGTQRNSGNQTGTPAASNGQSNGPAAANNQTDGINVRQELLDVMQPTAGFGY